MKIFSFIIILLFSSSPLLLFPQVSKGGQPVSFTHGNLSEIPMVSIPVPDMGSARAEDKENENLGLPERVGIAVKAGVDVIRDGMKEILPDGTQIWRISVTCDSALALGLYFDDFHLTGGCNMFVYDNDSRNVIGAYTLYNNSQNKLFSTELVPGDHIVLEINAGKDLRSCRPVISQRYLMYTVIFPIFPLNRGTSDDCEVNINCPEGDNWQYQKHGVARIYVKYNSGFYWCTGALLNNTLQNNEPFLLTADHCAPTASPDDLAQWIFYFNYEAPGCENPSLTPPSNSMTGAVKLANANTTGSDFCFCALPIRCHQITSLTIMAGALRTCQVL